MIRLLAALLFVMTGCTSLPDRVSQGPLPTGSGIAAFEGVPGKIRRVHYHRPAAYRRDSPILMVLHGVKRNADWYRDAWRNLSDRHGFLILAPEFDRANFPGGRSYNRGNMRRKDGVPLPQREWAFNAIEVLFDSARNWTGSTREGYLMFGHSAGAQFVHRMVTFMPTLRMERAMAANAGWYTIPEQSEKYPYGLNGAPLTRGQLQTVFSRKLTILVGGADNDPDHRYLHNSPAAKRQGAHRFARAMTYFERAKNAAERIGAPFAWSLEVVAGAGHATHEVKEKAAEILFGFAEP